MLGKLIGGTTMHDAISHGGGETRLFSANDLHRHSSSSIGRMVAQSRQLGIGSQHVRNVAKGRSRAVVPVGRDPALQPP